MHMTVPQHPSIISEVRERNHFRSALPKMNSRGRRYIVWVSTLLAWTFTPQSADLLPPIDGGVRTGPPNDPSSPTFRGEPGELD